MSPARKQPHVLVVPFPAQGHINPALAFAKCLASKDVRITVITTTRIVKSATIVSLSCSSLITIESVSDGSEEVVEPETIEGYFKRFRAVLSRNLEKFIDEKRSSDGGFFPDVIVYDSSMPWVLDIAHEKGLRGASFFTQSCAVCAVYYHLKEGSITIPVDADDDLDKLYSLPSLPTLGADDLPSFSEFTDPNQTIVTLLADQFSNLDRVDWIFFNTFDGLESEIVSWMASRWPIKTVGPTFSLMQKENNKFSDNTNHAINLFEPINHKTVAQWLDSKETASVIYVSFGSIASLGKEQMEEMAWGLLASGRHFLWVVRATEVEKLPQDFIDSLPSEKGLITDWCPQPYVLAHRAVACFVTHCGWNSTLEALSYGVPLVAMARWVDQTMNAKFIEDVWGVGVRVRAGENGIVGREEIAMCIENATDQGGKGVELRANASKWRELAREAVGEGGTSVKNIEDFVEVLCT